MAPFSESRNFRGWWTSKTSLEQKLVILSSLLFILSFCLTITVIVLANKKPPVCEGTTTLAPTDETTETDVTLTPTETTIETETTTVLETPTTPTRPKQAVDTKHGKKEPPPLENGPEKDVDYKDGETEPPPFEEGLEQAVDYIDGETEPPLLEDAESKDTK